MNDFSFKLPSKFTHEAKICKCEYVWVTPLCKVTNKNVDVFAPPPLSSSPQSLKEATFFGESKIQRNLFLPLHMKSLSINFDCFLTTPSGKWVYVRNVIKKFDICHMIVSRLNCKNMKPRFPVSDFYTHHSEL